MILTVVIFLVILSVLVFVHELGHFVVAKKSGMKVEEFGFGFPPRVFGIVKQDGRWQIVWGKKAPITENTIYSVNAIPLGGFVKILGEDNADEHDQRSFVNKPFWPRFATLVAGVVMNVITAWLIFAIGFMVGLPTAISDVSDVPSNARFTRQSTIIAEVSPDSPADKAGLKANDIFEKVDDQSFATTIELQSYLKSNAGKEYSFKVKRGAEDLDLKVQSVAKEGQPAVGIGLAEYGTIKFSTFAAVIQSVNTVFTQIGAIFGGLYNLFTTTTGLKSVGGPVKIAQLTGQVAQLGLLPLLQFTAFLSLNLAVLNILPIPALDGGRLMFLIIEKLRGKPNNQNLEQYVNAIGFMVLLALMLVISIRDVSQLHFVKNLFN